MKIGLYGGTFDPIHFGHIKIAEKAVEQLNLDEMWLIPAKIPPHKMGVDVTGEKHRLNMLEEAVNSMDSRYKINTYELNNNSVSYSYLTLTEFTQKYKNDKFYFIMGEDSLRDFPKWKHPEIISKLVEIVVAPRLNSHNENILKYQKLYSDEYGTVVHILDFPLVEVSSTEVREKLKAGENISGLIPESVYCYIKKHNLYK